jgi:hypothetical protein
MIFTCLPTKTLIMFIYLALINSNLLLLIYKLGVTKIEYNNYSAFSKYCKFGDGLSNRIQIKISQTELITALIIAKLSSNRRKLLI